MREIHARVGLVVSILKVVHPAVLIGIDINNACIKEVPLAGKGAGDRLVDNTTLLVDVSGVFRDHDHLVGIDRNIGIAHTISGVKLVLAQSCRRIVVPFVAVNHLLRIELTLASDRVGVINALDGTKFILVRPFPRDGSAPV